MTFTPFSQRNGYIVPTLTAIKEDMPENVLNSVHNIFTEMWTVYNISPVKFDEMAGDFGRYYLNLRIENNQHKRIDPRRYIDYEELEWYYRIDVIEWMFNYLYHNLSEYEISKLEICIVNLNKEFERHRYGYRVVKGLFVETTSDEDVKSIDTAISAAGDNVATHLKQAISSISPANPNPDFRNSIKESISAVGSFLREKFGGKTLGDALKNMQKNYPNLLHRFIIQSIESLYTYTNQPNTGIRHELLSQDYLPDHSDATFMLVQASSIINYVTNKLSIVK